MYINCRNVNESNTTKLILSVLCSSLKNKKCGLYFVLCAKIHFVSWKNFSNVEKHFVSQKKFWSSSSKKHFVSQAKNIYDTGVVDREKASWKNLIVNLVLIFNSGLIINSILIFKHSKILIRLLKLT